MEEKKSFFAFLGKWKNGKGRLLLLLLALLGVALLLFGGMQGSKEGSVEDYIANTEKYRASMERDLTALCRKIGGVGEITVYVTLECGEEYVFAADENASGEVSRSP